MKVVAHFYMVFTFLFCSLIHAKVHANFIIKEIPQGLSAGWAQELVGADLAREFTIANARNRHVPIAVIELSDTARSRQFRHGKSVQFIPPRSSFRSLDFDESEHATAVAFIISGPAPYGAGAFASVEYLIQNGDSNITHQLLGNIDKLPPVLTNISIGLNTPGLFQNDVFALSRKSLIVTSGGNDFPKLLIDRKVPYLSLNISSIRADGLVSDFSTPGPEIDLAAPSDWEMMSSTEENRLRKFGGTSGAAPLVTGILSNVAAISPELTPAEIRAIALETAIPSLSLRRNGNGNGNGNGKGIVNAYRAVRLAARLAARPKNSAPTDIHELRKLNHFEREAETLVLQAQTAPREKAIQLLRTSYFLDPKPSTAAKLAKLYRQTTTPRMALFYENQIPHLRHTYILDKYNESRTPGRKLSATDINAYIRAFSQEATHFEFSDAWEQLLSKKQFENFEAFITEADTSLPLFWSFLKETICRGSTQTKLQIIFYLESNPQRIQNESLFLVLLRDSDEFVQRRAIWSRNEARDFSKSIFQQIQKMAMDGSAKVRADATDYLEAAHKPDP